MNVIDNLCANRKKKKLQHSFNTIVYHGRHYLFLSTKISNCFTLRFIAFTLIGIQTFGFLFHFIVCPIICNQIFVITVVVVDIIVHGAGLMVRAR